MHRSAIIAEARKWLDTPFHHQGRVLGHGVDCYGVIEMVARAFNLPTPSVNYARIPDEAMLTGFLDQYAERSSLNIAQPGDIVVILFMKKMRHLAILTDIGLLHAYEPAGKVVEHSADEKWRRMFRRAYRFPGVIDG